MDLGEATRTSRRINLLHSYVGVLLVAFIHRGLIEALLELRNDIIDNVSENGVEPKLGETPLSTAVTFLLAEILHLSSNLLPARQCALLQQLPSVVEHAVGLNKDSSRRTQALSVISLMERFAHMRAKPTLNFHLMLSFNSTQRTIWGERRLDRIQEVRRKIDSQMDIETLKQRLIESGVMTIKARNYDQWKWEVISELFEGPLQNGSLVKTVPKRFFSRLLAFLNPQKGLFSEIETANPKKHTFISVSIAVIETLCVSSPNIFREARLLSEIGNVLKVELDVLKEKEFYEEQEKAKGVKKKFNSPMSRDKLEVKLISEYFTIIGVFTRHKVGRELLTQHNILKYITEMCKYKSREDIIRLILKSLDFTEDSETRQVHHILLENNRKSIRETTIHHLLLLLRLGIPDFWDWGIKLVYSKLTDHAPAVVEKSLEILHEASENVMCLENIISLVHEPSALLRHGAIGRSILYHFLRRPAGFENLFKARFVQEHIKLWKEQHNITYVTEIETHTHNSLNNILNLAYTVDNEGNGTYFYHYFPKTAGEIPTHFFGELSKTSEGCRLIEKRSVFNYYHKLVQACIDDSGEESELEKRAAMWAVGQMVSSSCGFNNLEGSSQAVHDIVSVAEHSSRLSFRSTAFVVIGFMSALPDARKIIESRGWEVNDARSIIAFPVDLEKSKFLTVPYEKAEYRLYMEEEEELLAEDSFLLDEEQMANHMLDEELTVDNLVRLVGKMVNRITSDKALELMLKVVKTYRDHPIQPENALAIYQLLGNFKIDIKYRQAIHKILGNVDFDSVFRLIDERD
eukprot:TRINITY_DN4369_c0_g1_i3.p1 TRINITY_DN4369_c0_g1~~TRINITY_DN4369_c0_g1_i3.p1  ORF type:complete len:803 (-),score=205.11 TRINITY_DN4369_c0_g1_i3:203-2611(-)